MKTGRSPATGKKNANIVAHPLDLEFHFGTNECESASRAAKEQEGGDGESMQATQSRRASGSWRRDGKFAALRYVSRHLEIDAGLHGWDSVECGRGGRWELFRAVEEPSPIKGDSAENASVEEDSQAGPQPTPQRAAGREKGTTGWIGC